MGLPPLVEQYFFDATHRGFDVFLNNPAQSIERVTLGSLSEGRVVELVWGVARGVLQPVRFKAFGDPYVIAAFAYLCHLVEGNSLEALSKISVPQMAEALEIPAHKASCLLLIDDALQHLRTTGKEQK